MAMAAVAMAMAVVARCRQRTSTSPTSVHFLHGQQWSQGMPSVLLSSESRTLCLIAHTTRGGPSAR